MGELLDQAFGPIVDRVPSASQHGVLYEIRRSATDGQLRCSCPGFQYRRTCKHVIDMARRDAASSTHDAPPANR